MSTFYMVTGLNDLKFPDFMVLTFVANYHCFPDYFQFPYISQRKQSDFLKVANTSLGYSKGLFTERLQY